jgi:Ca-activated chloride channel homolog
VKPRPRDVKLNTGREPKPASSATPAAAATATAALLLVLAVSLPTRSHAADLNPPPPPPPPPAAAPSPADLLAKIVGRLSVAETRHARDWSEFASETVLWGRRLQDEQHPVPEGPVRDALSAVDLGAAADAKAADWPKLREELEALLKKPEEKKNDQQQQKQQQQNQDQKNQEQKNQEQEKQQQPQDQKPSDQNQKSEPQNQNEEKKEPESAFGDMKDKTEPPPPPPQNDTQKVGGTPEKRPTDPAAADPTLAQPLQKLEQLRNEDSPAKLFQLMEGERKPAPNKKGKDW